MKPEDRPRKASAPVASVACCGPKLTTVRIKNPGRQARKLQLRLVGNHGVFELPKKYRQIQLEPGVCLSVPVRLAARNPYRIMGMNVEHRAYLQWKDENGTGLMMSAPIKVFAPLSVPPKTRPCLHTPVTASGRFHRRHHSPPDITRTLYRAGTTLVANMGEVDHHYNVNIEREDDWLEIDVVWPEAGAGITDSGGYEWALEHSDFAETFEVGETKWHRLTAGNDDGTSTDAEWFFAKREVGHRHVCIPDDPEVPLSESVEIRGFLEDVESWLSADGLVDFGRYVDYWNTNALADEDCDCNTLSFDEDGCWFNGGDPVPDLSYITAPVGGGGLADDMLAALEDLIVYTRPGHLPRTFRPDEHYDSLNSLLCDVPGFTYSRESRPAGTFGEWLAICRGRDANDMTIIHELFHYASREHYRSEDRAFLLSYLYIASRYGWKPAEDWTDWDDWE